MTWLALLCVISRVGEVDIPSLTLEPAFRHRNVSGVVQAGRVGVALGGCVVSDGVEGGFLLGEVCVGEKQEYDEQNAQNTLRIIVGVISVALLPVAGQQLVSPRFDLLHFAFFLGTKFYFYNDTSTTALFYHHDL